MKEKHNLYSKIFKYEGLYYNITNEEAKTVEVIHRRSDEEYTNEITIPSSVIYNDTTYTVTAIGVGAFFRLTQLNSINIPDTVTRIEADAFHTCFGLTAIKMSNSLAYIGDNAFYCCWGLPSITIPSSVIEIGSKAFLSCSKIEEVKIPHLVAQIGDGAFAACKNLKSIIVDSNNSYYDSREGCNAIIETATNTLIASCKGTTIPNSIVNIGNNAFEENQTLIGAVTIPNSIKRIGKEAFKGCRQMSSLSIPDALIEVGENAFYNTIWYNNATDGFLYWGNCCLGYKGSNDFNTLEIKEGTRIIANNAFANCRNLESVIIPASVIRIGSEAFNGCENLTSIIIPASVAEIGHEAFSGCSQLTSIIVDEGNKIYDSRENCNAIIETATNTLIAGCNNTSIPLSVTKIGDEAFYNCDKINTLTIHSSVTEIGHKAFSGCSQLTSIIVDAKNQTYDSRENCNAIIETATNSLILGCKNTSIPGSVAIIGDEAFRGCGIETVTIPPLVDYIGTGAFKNCRNLGAIEIPESVTEIGDEAFEDCYSLKKATIGNSVKRIGCKAFHACFNMTEVTIGSSVTEISMGAFEGCKELNSITIPESVAYLGDGVFWRCKDTILVFLYNPDIHAAGVYTFPEDARFLIMGS